MAPLAGPPERGHASSREASVDVPRQSPAQHLITAAVFGTLFLVSGLIGWDLRHSHGWFAGARWVTPPVWWELVVGTVLLVIAVVLARRIRRGL